MRQTRNVSTVPFAEEIETENSHSKMKRIRSRTGIIIEYLKITKMYQIISVIHSVSRLVGSLDPI